jgi:histidyl-tRNA synthetase
MAAATHKFQAPKGTRDFYPADMAVRRYLEGVWRDVSIGHGFNEIDGPTFEHLELYTVKSGPGIVSELFSFRRAGGETDYALRPEFTPTLARMFAARAQQLPKPTRWFSIASMFRAERPQRGRLREHFQWNVDIIGDDSVEADVEIIAVAVAMLERFGLTPETVTIKISDRHVVGEVGRRCGVDESNLADFFELLDKRDRTAEAEFIERSEAIGLDIGRFDEYAASARDLFAQPGGTRAGDRDLDLRSDRAEALRTRLHAAALGDWCAFDLGIVRGLAYYTGIVFEVHEATGKERAIAGGGRYDGLVELFGGSPTPAVGIAMGDVVIRLVLEERGLLEPAATYLPRPDAFVISSGTEQAEAALRPLVSRLRRAGLHARHSDRSTRNVGKLLGEAGKARARFAVILGAELDDGHAVVKDLDSGAQRPIALDELVDALAADGERSPS